MTDTITLSDGEMPTIGFGTWQLQGDDAYQAVQTALEVGYRLIDTAAIYGNEEAVGRAIADSGVDREDIFVTTKLWSGELAYDNAIEACKESLNKLGLEYVDLYLIHWPKGEARLDAWKALVDLKKEGKTKHIGVSNYTVRHLEELMQQFDEYPVVNQVEFHPHIYAEQEELLRFCEEHDIIVEAYSPLAQSELIDHPVVEEIAEATDKTPGQVLIRWALQHGTVPLPKSKTPSRIAENFEVFDFELDAHEMEQLDSISSGDRVTHDPAEHL